MKWMRFRQGGQDAFGTLTGDTIAVHRGDLFDAPTPTGEQVGVEAIEWLTPCRPSKVLALWNNFRASAEKNGWASPAEPLYLIKAPNSLAPHRATIPVPAGEVGRVAYEGELGIVIGRRAKGVSVADAPAHIFGYTCANDVTAIEVITRDPAFPQWTRAKGFDGFGVFGPVIETDFDFATASVRTTVAGRERQNYPLADCFFTPAEVVSRMSQEMTLEPGDVIMFGTSLGVLPMKPGSAVEVSIDGIGTLANVYG